MMSDQSRHDLPSSDPLMSVIFPCFALQSPGKELRSKKKKKGKEILEGNCKSVEEKYEKVEFSLLFVLLFLMQN